MSWLKNLVLFAQRFPFKCPKCESKDGEFVETRNGLLIRCQNCRASEEITREKIAELLSTPKQLNE